MRTTSAILLCAFVAGCAFKYTPAEGVTKFPQPPMFMCHQTSGGVKVYHQPPGMCPERRDVQAVLTRFRHERKLKRDIFRDVTLVFTPYTINCGGVETKGCMHRTGYGMIQLQGAWNSGDGWGEVLWHELAHLDHYIATKQRERSE